MLTKIQGNRSYYSYLTEEKIRLKVCSKSESVNSAINFDLNSSLFDYIQISVCFHLIPICSWRDKRRVEHSWNSQQKKIPELYFSLFLHIPINSHGLPGGKEPLLSGQI